VSAPLDVAKLTALATEVGWNSGRAQLMEEIAAMIEGQSRGAADAKAAADFRRNASTTAARARRAESDLSAIMRDSAGTTVGTAPRDGFATVLRDAGVGARDRP